MEDAEMELDDREPDDFEPEGRNVIKRVWTLEEDANPHPNSYPHPHPHPDPLTLQEHVRKMSEDAQLERARKVLGLGSGY